MQGFACSALAISTGPLNRLTFPAKMLGRATGYAAMLVAVGAASGPIVGGLILSVATWQWLFAIYVPIGVIAYVLATWKIPDFRGRGGAFDVRSAALSCATFVPAVYGLDGIGHHLDPWIVAAAFALSLGFGFVFIRRQRALPQPGRRSGGGGEELAVRGVPQRAVLRGELPARRPARTSPRVWSWRRSARLLSSIFCKSKLMARR